MALSILSEFSSTMLVYKSNKLSGIYVIYLYLWDVSFGSAV